MNKYGWDKKQQQIAFEQKQAAKEAKMAMLGVEPKAKPVSSSNWIEWPVIAIDYSKFIQPQQWIICKGPTKLNPLPISGSVSVQLDVDTTAYADALAQLASSWYPSPSYFGSGRKSVVGQLSDICPTLTAFAVACPECQGTGFGPLSNLIPHINDHHKWSRERIADWLETLDVDLTVKPIEKEPEVAKPSTSSEIKTESIFGPGKPLTWTVWPTALGKSEISDLYENLVGNTS